MLPIHVGYLDSHMGCAEQDGNDMAKHVTAYSLTYFLSPPSKNQQ